jgi:hypothetical protein
MLKFFAENVTALFSNEGLSYRGDCSAVRFSPPGITGAREKLEPLQSASWHFWVKPWAKASLAHVSYFESMQCCEVQFLLDADQFARFMPFVDKKIVHRDLKLMANVFEPIGSISNPNQFEYVEKTSLEEFLQGRNILSDRFWFELE